MGRPAFNIANARFKTIYGDGSLSHVAETIGGKVKQNIDAGIFENACAIRMSYVLNYSKQRIGSSPQWPTVTGSDGYRYIFRVRNLITYLEQQFGSAFSLQPNQRRDLADKQGILLFDVQGWNNATGHATLWNGATCSDHCYFPQAKAVRLWTLP